MFGLSLDAFLPVLAPETEGAGAPASTGTPPPVESTSTAVATAAPAITPAPDPAKTFTQADVDRLIGQARAEGKKQAKDEAERKRAEDAAKANGEWEQLATARETENAELKRQLAERDRALLVAKVAAKHGLSELLAGRLRGDDEPALEADAKALAKEVGTRAAPDTEAGVGTNGTATGPGDRPRPKPLSGPVYGFDGQKKVPWPNRAPQR